MSTKQTTSGKPKTVSKTAAKSRASKGSAKKLDLYAKHKNEYVASAKRAGLVRVGPARYLAVAGTGAPASDEFTRAIAALYDVAYTLKMARKAAGQDYTVTRLEGLWTVDAPRGQWSDPENRWSWDLLIRVPPFITERELRGVVEQLVAKGKSDDVRKVRLLDLTEGECVQMLHVGPYATEQETIAKMRDFAQLAGRKVTGRHHEIYLSDPRRVAPEKLKTILRLPVT